MEHDLSKIDQIIDKYKGDEGILIQVTHPRQP